MTKTTLGVLSACLIATMAVAASSARAQSCGTVNLDSGNNTAIVGELLQWNASLGAYIPIGTGKIGVCWQDQYGIWRLAATNCPAYWSFLTLQINAGAGDDTVVAHPPSGYNFSCSDDATYIIAPADWQNVFHVGLDARMGTGSDTFWGTPNADTAFSNDTSGTADGVHDSLCGYDGNDTLTGDSDSSGGSVWIGHECLNGGGGTDTCNGVTNSSPDYDDGWYCEPLSNSRNSYTQACRSASGDTDPWCPYTESELDLSPPGLRCPTYCHS